MADPTAITGTWTDMERHARWCYEHLSEGTDAQELAEAVLVLLGAERGMLAERDAARQQAQTLREAAKDYLFHSTILPTGFPARDRLRALLVAVPDTEKGAEQAAQSPETGDVRGGEQA